MDPTNLVPILEPVYTHPACFPTRVAPTELETFRKFISRDLVEDGILLGMNRQLEALFARAKTTKKIYRQLDYATWERAYLSYLLEGLLNSGCLRGEAATAVELRSQLIGKQRYKAWFSCFQLLDEELQDLAVKQRVIAARNFTIGNQITVDEQLFEYRGSDMRGDNVDVNIPHKPHPYGVLAYTACSKLLWSGLSVPLDSEIRLVGNVLSPADAARRLLLRLKERVPYGIHVALDSAFAAAATLAALHAKRIHCTISVSGSNQSGYNRHIEAMAHGLPNYRSRTLTDTTFVLQAVQQGNRVQAVASNAFKCKSGVEVDIRREKEAINYDAAVALFSNSTGPQLHAWLAGPFELPADIDPTDSVAILKHATGHDVIRPPPVAGRRAPLTQDNLMAMTLAQLRGLHASTPRCVGGTSKNKEQLTTEILSRHPEAAVPPADVPGSPQTLEAMRGAVLGEHSPAATLIAWYNDHYGLIDQVDRLYYESFEAAFHGNYRKLLLGSMLQNTLVAARAAFIERLLELKPNDRERQLAAVHREGFIALPRFIIRVAQQLLAA